MYSCGDPGGPADVVAGDVRMQFVIEIRTRGLLIRAPIARRFAPLPLVVHDTMAASSGSGAKMLCADLVGSAGEYSGEIAYLASFTGAGYSATGYGSIRKGEASMSFAGTTTAISFKGTGFPDGVFKSHLHAADCASGSGGVSHQRGLRHCSLQSDLYSSHPSLFLGPSAPKTARSTVFLLIVLLVIVGFLAALPTQRCDC